VVYFALAPRYLRYSAPAIELNRERGVVRESPLEKQLVTGLMLANTRTRLMYRYAE
jgi:hypothetical protein